MLKIRLQRTGKRGQAHFRVVVLEGTVKPKGEYLELLGSYNPHQKEFKVKKDRIDFWISKGAQVSPTVNNLLVNYKVWDKEKMQSWKPKKKEAPPEAAEGQKEAPAAAAPQPEEKKGETPKGEHKPEQPVEEKKEESPKEESKEEKPKEEKSA